MNPTMRHARYSGTYVLLAHGAAAPTDAEWSAYLKDAAKWMPTATGQIVLTDGGGPTSAQRRALKELLSSIGHPPIRTAVISGSMLARGIVLAIGLFTPRIRAFAPDDPTAAFAYVHAPAFDHPGLLAELTRMRQQLG